jgi:hypothetical protein
MGERIKKNPEFALRRREFLKMGLAAGVVAWIPIGVIPKIGTRKAYAQVVKGSKAVEKIPAEARWTIATQGLTGSTAVTSKALREAVGQDKYDEILVQIWTEAGKASKEIADALGLAPADAKSVAETVRSVEIVMMGPEFEFELVEAKAERAAHRWTECVWWNRQKELGLSGELCIAGCPAYNSALAKSLNPKVTARLTKAKPRGDAYCEYVFQL